MGCSWAFSCLRSSPVGSSSRLAAPYLLALCLLKPVSSQLKVNAIVYAYFIFQKTILSLENPSKSIFAPKNTKPFPEIL
jgi:hypothetical protein